MLKYLLPEEAEHREIVKIMACDWDGRVDERLEHNWYLCTYEWN